MSRLACKSTWRVSGCPHHHQGLKSPAPRIGIETGSEIPGRTGRGHTAPGSIIRAGTHQTGHERLTGGLAVKQIEKGTARNLGKFCTLFLGTQDMASFLKENFLFWFVSSSCLEEMFGMLHH